MNDENIFYLFEKLPNPTLIYLQDAYGKFKYACLIEYQRNKCQFAGETPQNAIHKAWYFWITHIVK